ncbi:MAG: membrane protein insertion efficiency factor YidD [Patescibacteria group bacterium]
MDRVLSMDGQPKGLLINLIWIPRRIVRGMILIYQKTLSPDHGFVAPLFTHPVCKYHPTCSEYGYQAITKYGVIRGMPMAIYRILRCNPWSHGGHDPVL